MSETATNTTGTGGQVHPMVMQQSLQAREFAAVAHVGQTYGPGEPYTAHLDAVASLVGDDDTTQAIAYLHDVVEDTPVPLAIIKETFGPFVAECVALLTDEPGINRKERKAKSHAKLAKVEISHCAALVVKAADRCANVEACVRKGNKGLWEMYRREQEAFRAAAYRPGLCDNLWNRIDAALAA
jgi:(p)ppGpp synthase/HD superfamily hydrolase